MIKQIIRINEKTLVIDDTKYKRVRNLGRGKSGYVDLYESNGELIAVKFYEYETDDPKINPIPEEEILSYEVSVYEELVKLDIPLAQLLGYDSKLKILVKEYINGSNIIDLVAENKIDDDIWKKIFKISKKVTEKGKNIDYFPANFILRDGSLVYVDYELEDFDSEWSFEDWAIFYWINGEGIRKFLETGNGDFINKPGIFRPYDDIRFQKKRNIILNNHK